MKVSPYFVRSCSHFAEGYGTHYHYTVGRNDICGQMLLNGPIGHNHQVLAYGMQTYAKVNHHNRHVVKVGGRWWYGGEEVPNPVFEVMSEDSTNIGRGMPLIGDPTKGMHI